MMKMQTYKIILFSAIICLFITSSLWAQAGRGEGRIQGTIVDENNKGIPSAKIVCEFKDNPEIKMEANTNDKGKWAILGIGTGMWKITASKEGYVPATTEIYVRQLQRNPKIDQNL